MVSLLHRFVQRLRRQRADPPLDLFVAAAEGDTAALRSLFGDGIDVNARLTWDREDGPAAIRTIHRLKDSAVLPLGWTPLMFAAYHSHLKAVRLLVERGADVDAVSEDGWTALQLAGTRSHREIVRFLRERSVSIGDLDVPRGLPAAPRAPWPPLDLFVAAHQGDVEAVKSLLQGGADPNLRLAWPDWHRERVLGRFGPVRIWYPDGRIVDPLGWTPLMFAAYSGHDAAALALLGGGANVNATAPNGTVVQLAARRGHAATVELLLRHGAIAGGQALVSAVESGALEPMRVLLDHSGCPEAHDPATNRALITAIRSGSAEAVQLLMDRGFDPNARDAEGWTALTHAAYSGFREVVQVLRQSGARVGLREAAMLGDLSGAEAALRAGEAVDSADHTGHTALHWAAGRGHTAIVRLLLDCGADFLRQDGAGWSPLLRAAHIGSVECVRLLLDRGADIVSDGRVALSFAADGGHTDVMLLLRDRGVQDVSSFTNALYSAAEQGQTHAATLLLDWGADARGEGSGNTPLMTAAWNGHVEVAHLLLEAGADMNAEDDEGLTALEIAAEEEQVEVVRFLRDAGARIGVADAALIGDVDTIRELLDAGWPPDSVAADGTPALMRAAEHGNTAAVGLLLERGAAVDLCYGDWTPLMWAVREGHTETAAALIEGSADVNASGWGTTPLMLAAISGHSELTRLLLAHGADPAATDRAGLTALDHAVQMEHPEVADILRAAAGPTG